MSFLRKKRIKFAIELIVARLTDVSLLNARLFAKVRLLECSSFEATTESRELRGHTCLLYAPPPPPLPPATTPIDTETPRVPPVDGDPSTMTTTPTAVDPLYDLAADQAEHQPFRVQCRIPYNAETLALEECRCKISVRKVERGSRAATKLGFVIVNLSEFAASGTTPVSRSYLLEGYTDRRRQDNTRVHIVVRAVNQTTDPLFKIPQTVGTLDDSLLNPRDRKAAADDEPPMAAAATPTTPMPPPSQPPPPLVAAPPLLPQSATLTSFSSSSSESAALAAAASTTTMTGGSGGGVVARESPTHGGHSHHHLHATPHTSRFSAPTAAAELLAGAAVAASGRRTSALPALERAATGATAAAATNVDHPIAGSSATLVGHGAPIRRASDDRLHLIGTAGSTAGGGGGVVVVPPPPNVPNRIQVTRRDAVDVIEELIAEAAAVGTVAVDESSNGATTASGHDVAAATTSGGGGLFYDTDFSSDGAFDRSDHHTPKSTRAADAEGDRRRLELLVSRKNGDVLVVDDATTPMRASTHFERVRLDSSLTS